ncbi:response regulator transcription factor [Virgisporangium ochraceum]
MIRVLVADDQEAVRIAFRTILNAADDIEVVGEAADGAEAAEQARRLRPDVCLVDIRMPGMDGLELTRVLSTASPPVRVVVVATDNVDAYVHTVLGHGACGFLLKHSGAALLVQAVRAAVAGDALISPEVTVRLLRELAVRPAVTPPNPLTDRELDVVALVAEGKTNAEIGAQLYITAGTVKTHLASIQQKLGVSNRVAIAAWAWATGHRSPLTP